MTGGPRISEINKRHAITLHEQLATLNKVHTPTWPVLHKTSSHGPDASSHTQRWWAKQRMMHPEAVCLCGGFWLANRPNSLSLYYTPLSPCIRAWHMVPARYIGHHPLHAKLSRSDRNTSQQARRNRGLFDATLDSNVLPAGVMPISPSN